MTSEKIRRGTRAYRHISLTMLMAGLATFAVFYCVQPLLPLFGKEYGVSAEEASLVVSITIGPMAIALLLAGVISDRIGRRSLMSGALFAAALCTLLCAIAESWRTLLALRLLAGLSLAGIPAVAMTYIVEEVEDAAIGHAMGLYIAGTAMGGMTGRLLGGLLADHSGWRLSMGVIGGSVLAMAILFRRYAPPSSHFVPRHHSFKAYQGGLRRLFGDPVIPWLFIEALLLMGAFVSLYNYVSYRLVAPPYGLNQSTVGAIFLLYVVGSFSSARAGAIAGLIGPGRTFGMLLLMFLAGIILTAFTPLPIVILGMAVLTASFFGAHSVASTWVSRRAGDDRAQASALYLFFYYAGGSVLGSLGGFAWTAQGWNGVSLYSGALIALAALTALHLASMVSHSRPVP